MTSGRVWCLTASEDEGVSIGTEDVRFGGCLAEGAAEDRRDP